MLNEGEYSMNKIKYPLIGALVVGCISTAVNAETYTVSGEVINSTPKYTTITDWIPKNVCNVVQIPIYGSQPDHNSSGMGAIVGGLAGGILGNTIGRGSGRTAATIGGAILGGVVGNNVESNTNRGSGTSGRIVGYREEQRCRVQHDRKVSERLTGYTVTYEALGFKGTVIKPTSYRAGDKINVRVTFNAR